MKHNTPEAADLSAPPVGVEAKNPVKRKRGGNRGGGRRSTVRQIQAVAQERQVAWSETDQRELTKQLTGKLDELYVDLRDLRKGVDPGRHLRTSSAVAQWQSEDTR